MGNAITAALREPGSVALADAMLPYNNLRVRDIEAYWRSFYDHASSFALTRAQLRVICSKAASLLDVHASSSRAMLHADHAFDLFAVKTTNSTGDATIEVMDALEFLSAMAFIATIPIQDKIDLIFDSWDMSEDGALDLDEVTISLKSTLLGLSKVLKFPVSSKSESKPSQWLSDEDIEILAERVFREIAKITSVTASLNQVVINCEEFRTYCMENTTARAIFDVFDRAESLSKTKNQLDDDESELVYYDTTKTEQPKDLFANRGAQMNHPRELPFVIDQGDEFLAVKPWKGAVVAPSKAPSLSKAAPIISIALEWVFGYNAQDSKNNVRYCTGCTDEIVYPAAAACVLLNIRRKVQRHYLAHSDDVLCLSVHPQQPIVASGEIGKVPKINVWNSTTLDTLCVLQGYHQRGVMSVAFCGPSTLISIGNDDDHSVAVYVTQDGWKSAALVAFSKGNKAEPLHLCPKPGSAPVEFVCCAEKSIDFWTFDGKALAHKRAVLGTKGSAQAFHVAEYIANGSTLVVGTNDGCLYLFTGRELSSVAKGNGGAVQALGYCSGTLIVGTKGGHVSVWDDRLRQLGDPFLIKDASGGLSCLHPGVRSCVLSTDKKAILVGTAASEILELDFKTGKNLHSEALASGHFLGETWGLDSHPSKPQCCTVGDDCTLRIWDLQAKKELRSVKLDMPARACAYSSDGKLIAVGLGAGGIITGNRSSQSISRGKRPTGGFVVFTEHDLARVKEACYEPKKWVSDVKFSPDGRTLAVASHDTVVYFYDVLNGFSKKHAFKKHTSYVSHVDFSSDGLHLQSTCGGYELLFCEVQTARHVANSSSLRDERWHTMTSTLGWPVQGIWEDCSDGTDVNSVDRSKDGTLLATGDDFGKVKIFRYPCAIEKASYVELRGHSSHVTKVKWSLHDKWILSAGGNDRCLFVWRNENSLNTGIDLAHTENMSPHRRKAKPNKVDAAKADDDYINNFDAVENDVGDEFMAVKPWLGAIVPPSWSKTMKISSSVPDARLELDRVNGYQAQNAANNARYDGQGRIVYHAAALGVVYDKTSQRQSFFRSHDDDIVALCVHPNRTTFATAQMGKRPKVFTWSSSNPSKVISCLEGFHQRGIPAMCFSSDGKKLGSVGGDDDHSVAIYSWENGLLLATAKGERSNVKSMCYHGDEWITCGDKHIRFWREQSRNLTSKKAVFGKVKHKEDKIPSRFECVVSFGDLAVVGASNGDLYVFQGSNEVSRTVRAHDANVYAIFASVGLVSGGKDGTIMVWDMNITITFKFDLKEHAPTLGIFDSQIRSIAFSGSSSHVFLIGTGGSDLIELDTSRQASMPSASVIVTRGHSQMELWGLASHPTRPEYCTTGDDQMLRVWCLEKKALLRQVRLDTMARACAIFASGKTEVIGVGFGGRHAAAASRNAKAQIKSGSVVILQYDELYKTLFEDKPSKQPISEIKFSPNGLVLAVGSHDNHIYLYKIHDLSFKKVTKTATFAKHHSYITHFDFSCDGKFIQSNCGAYELLFSDATSGKQITSASSTRDVKWESWTCVLGWPVQGIWPPCSDGTDVNAVDRSHNEDLLATSDDFGLVKLYRYPCTEKNASFVEYRGHSSHVTNIRWSPNDRYVVSIGGNDRCIIEWKVVRDNETMSGDLSEENHSRTENTSSSDGEVEDIEGDEFMAVKPWVGAIVAPSNAPTPNAREPDLRVELDWVYGYQTELSKQNLAYNSYGEIVYHTAAVGIIFDHKNHIQKHHLCHNDDITSFAISPKRDLAATGERGKKPVIRVWDAHTGELRSELRGFHTRGVVSLAFSTNASKLVSVGDDDDHSVALWEDMSHGSWTLAKLFASARGDKALNSFSIFGSDEMSIITGGVKHILFWRVEGKTLMSKKGKVGKKGSLQLFPTGCLFGNDVVTGTSSGELYVWTGEDLTRVIKAHECESTIVCSQETPTPEKKTGVLVSGGKDGKVIMWNSSFQPLKTIDLGVLSSGCIIKAIASATLSVDGHRLLLGTGSSDILEVDISNGTVLHGGKPLVSGHFSLELWGLATHPTKAHFVTTGDDATMRMWDMESKRPVAMTKLATKSRACAYSPDGSLLAVGFGGDNGTRRKVSSKGAQSKEGGFVVISTSDGSVQFEDRPAKEWISDTKFSPCGTLLGVGSHDNAIHLYSTSGNGVFKKRKPFAKHNSYITHFDFSRDSRFIQSNCGAYELLFCDTSTSEQVRSATSLKDTTWHTWTCTLGWPVQGIWPECADGTDINAVCSSSSRTILATGDDSSKVKFFRYPCTMKAAKFIEARGHASHVTNVRFSADDKYLISVGGNDRSIFQWKLN